jgi:hypothetical protein
MDQTTNEVYLHKIFHTIREQFDAIIRKKTETAECHALHCRLCEPLLGFPGDREIVADL